MAIGHLPDCGILGRGPLRYPGIVPRLPLKTELILDMWRKWSDKRRECLVSWRMRRRVWRCGYILVDPTQWLNTRSGFKSMVKHMIYIYIYMTWHDMTWHDMIWIHICTSCGKRICWKHLTCSRPEAWHEQHDGDESAAARRGAEGAEQQLGEVWPTIFGATLTLMW